MNDLVIANPFKPGPPLPLPQDCADLHCGAHQTCASVLVGSSGFDPVTGQPKYHYELRCVCAGGYKGKGVHGQCVDMDECAQGNSVCGENAICVNTEGGYRCDCPAGYHDFGMLCCPPGKVAYGGHCEPCGQPGQRCCDPSTGSPCVPSAVMPGAVCSSKGICAACGSVGQPCCTPGPLCGAWAFCSAGDLCQSCGKGGEVCCGSPALACIPGFACNTQSNQCEVWPCGKAGEPCCPSGMACEQDLACNAGSKLCEACGGEGQLCCAAGQAGTNASGCDCGLICKGTCRHCTPSEIYVGGACLPAPNAQIYHGKLTEDSELNDVESEEMQGIAVGPKGWYWISRYEINRTDLQQWTTQLTAMTLIPDAFSKLGYDHFGDGDVYGDRLYVPLTGEGYTSVGATHPAVLVYDLDLKLVAWGILSHGGGAWTSVNPNDGRLYTSEPFDTLRVYDRNSVRPYQGESWQQLAGLIDQAGLGYVGEIKLNFKHVPGLNDFDWCGNLPEPWSSIFGHTPQECLNWWWSRVMTQGGSFSPNGVLYYVLDHANQEESPWTGAHVFKIQHCDKPQGTAGELTLAGDDGMGFLHASYSPTAWGYRADELEGIVAYKAQGTTYVLLLLLSNEGGSVEDDDVTTYYWSVNEP